MPAIWEESCRTTPRQEAGGRYFIFYMSTACQFRQLLRVSDIDWSFVVGGAVGFSGADRCRYLINAAVTLFASKKGINDDQR